VSAILPLDWGKLTAERRLPLTALALALALAAFPLTGPSNYLLHVIVLVFVYVSLGMGLNIVVGFAGLLDLGYVAFYAVGAYSYALLSLHYQIPFIPALLVGAGLAALIGVLLGWPTIRTRGDYLALVTLGFGEIIRLLLRNWDSLTNGPRGLMNIPSPSVMGFTFSNPARFYYLGLLLGMFSICFSWKIKYSDVGQQLAAIQDDEVAAASIGINPARWKLYAFALGAFVAGMSGVFFASWQQFVSPESFTLGESILVLSIVVLGGMGRLWPTVAAAALLVLLPEVLRGLETYRILVLGVLLVVIVVMQEKLRLSALKKRRSTSLRNKPSEVAPLSPLRTVPRRPIGKTLLSVSHVSKHFGGICALQDVSFEIMNCEIVGLVGANGAGKTTLFNCIAQTIPADTGKIYLHNNNGKVLSLTGQSAFQAARLGVVRTFQQPRLFHSLPAVTNVKLGQQCRNIPALWEPLVHFKYSDGSDSSAANLLHRFGSATYETMVEGMSFVDQKLTELARAIATQPEILLVDEPASGMEPLARQSLSQALRWANETLGLTMIVIEHDLEFLRTLCDRIVVMDRGSVIATGAPQSDQVVRAIRRTLENPETIDAIA